MSLDIAISDIRKNYSDSVRLLISYVRDIDVAIKKMQVRKDKLAKRLVAYRDGKPNEAPPFEANEETVHVEFEIDVLDEFIKEAKQDQVHSSTYPHLASKMAFVYLIATFDAYLSDIFEVVILNRPAILKSKKQISYEKILEFSSTSDLIQYLAKRELNELSYKSIKDQADFYSERFGLALEDSGVSISELIEMHTTRNVLVHNNGVVNHIYLEQLPSTTYKLGDELLVDSTYFYSVALRLDKVVEFISIHLNNKFTKLA